MNYPTREEFEQLKEDVRKLKEQQTEPIKITRLEIEMHGARADILQIRESQADLRDRLIEHSEDHAVMKEKQNAHTELLGDLINVGEDHTKRFDQLHSDVTGLKTTADEQGQTLQEHGQLLREILSKLK